MNPLHTLTKPRFTVLRVVTVVVLIIFKLDLYTRIHVIYSDITFVVTHVFKQGQKALFIPRQKPFLFDWQATGAVSLKSLCIWPLLIITRNML